MDTIKNRESIEDLNLDHDFTIQDESYDLNHDFIITGIAYSNYVTEEVAASIQKDIDDHFAGEYAEYDRIFLALCTNSSFENDFKLGEVNPCTRAGINQDFYCLSFSDSDVVLLLTK